MLLASQTLTAQVWMPALSQTKFHAASCVNLGSLNFKPPVVSYGFFFCWLRALLAPQGFSRNKQAAQFKQPRCWYGFCIFFLLLTTPV